MGKLKGSASPSQGLLPMAPCLVPPVCSSSSGRRSQGWWHQHRGGRGDREGTELITMLLPGPGGQQCPVFVSLLRGLVPLLSPLASFCPLGLASRRWPPAGHTAWALNTSLNPITSAQRLHGGTGLSPKVPDQPLQGSSIPGSPGDVPSPTCWQPQPSHLRSPPHLGHPAHAPPYHRPPHQHTKPQPYTCCLPPPAAPGAVGGPGAAPRGTAEGGAPRVGAARLCPITAAGCQALFVLRD